MTPATPTSMTEDQWALLVGDPLFAWKGEQSVTARDVHGRNALLHAIHLAAMTPSRTKVMALLGVCRALLDDGADPMNETLHGDQPLFFATASHLPDLLPMFLAHGLDIRAVCNGQNLPQQTMTGMEHGFSEAAIMLMDAGLWPDPDTAWGQEVRESIETGHWETQELKVHLARLDETWLTQKTLAQSLPDAGTVRPPAFRL
jgi:hypothetical protein